LQSELRGLKESKEEVDTLLKAKEEEVGRMEEKMAGLSDVEGQLEALMEEVEGKKKEVARLTRVSSGASSSKSSSCCCGCGCCFKELS